MTNRKYFNHIIAFPQDHGSWVFIFSPLVVGLFAGGTFSYASFSLVIAAMAAFLLRQPMSVIVKVYAGRRPRTDLPAARLWVGVYGVIALLALAELFTLGDGYIALLAIPGAPVFAWHLWLVSRRAERHKENVEIIATGVLSLAAPAAYWIGRGGYDPFGWWLWALTWAQTAASIVYAYLRLEQRQLPAAPSVDGGPQSKAGAANQPQGPTRSEKWRMGRRALLYTSFNLAVTLILGGSAILPRWICLPYLVQWAEAVWGIEHPSAGWKPVRIGTRQLVVSILWTILFVITWRLT